MLLFSPHSLLILKAKTHRLQGSQTFPTRALGAWDNRFTMNYEFERETGFINSRPSLAECLTSFPPVDDSFQKSSIKSSALRNPHPLILPPFEHTIPSLSLGTQPRYAGPRHSLDGGSPLYANSLTTEYPWMREKKTNKRNCSLTPTGSLTPTAGVICFSPKGEF